MKIKYNKYGYKSIAIKLYEKRKKDKEVLDKLIAIGELGDITVADYIKNKILGKHNEFKKANVYKVNYEIFKEINRMFGPALSNINQIARTLNYLMKENKIEKEDIKTAIIHLFAIKVKINEIYEMFLSEEVKSKIIKTEKLDTLIDKIFFENSNDKLNIIFDNKNDRIFSYKNNEILEKKSNEKLIKK